MTGLREQQRQNRQKRIIAEARLLFETKGYEKTTMEDIGAASGVSGMTVHNYFTSKGGILVAFLESEKTNLSQTVQDALGTVSNDLLNLAEKFAKALLGFAEAKNEQKLWKHAMAAVVSAPDRSLVLVFIQLRQILLEILSPRIKRLQTEGALSQDIDADGLATALYQLLTPYFIRFVTIEDEPIAVTVKSFVKDLKCLMAVN